jgi:rhodanese-related sulfurtransferase
MGPAVVGIIWILATSISPHAAEVPVMTPAEARSLIQKNRANPQFVVLDVRTPQEFKAGHLEGAINVDINGREFRDEIGRLDRQKTYLVYCRTGRRTGEAVRIMRDLGFENLLRFEGDIVRWRAENLPLVK